jgi:hypothetical protein
LDALVLTVRAVADEGVDLRVDDATIEAGVVGTGKTVGGDASWGASPALKIPPRSNR